MDARQLGVGSTTDDDHATEVYGLRLVEDKARHGDRPIRPELAHESGLAVVAAG